MTYTINRMAALSGVSARTLRYYEQIGLLQAPRRGVRDAIPGRRIGAWEKCTPPMNGSVPITRRL